jgi:hypothetical protein
MNCVRFINSARRILLSMGGVPSRRNDFSVVGYSDSDSSSIPTREVMYAETVLHSFATTFRTELTCDPNAKDLVAVTGFNLKTMRFDPTDACKTRLVEFGDWLSKQPGGGAGARWENLADLSSFKHHVERLQTAKVTATERAEAADKGLLDLLAAESTRTGKTDAEVLSLFPPPYSVANGRSIPKY